MKMTLSEREKNALVKKYDDLICKMINQYFQKGCADWQTLKSMALEGFAIAIDTYDEERSKMNFTQFAAYAIRNNILNSLTNEIRTVKMSYYHQKKAEETGQTLWTTVSVDSMRRGDEDNRKPLEVSLGMVSQETFSDGDIFEYMYTRLEKEFDEVELKIFYMTFGLKGYEEMKGCDIAKELGISGAKVSLRKDKILKWIKKDEELCEVLSNLLQK